MLVEVSYRQVASESVQRQAEAKWHVNVSVTRSIRFTAKVGWYPAGVRTELQPLPEWEPTRSRGDWNSRSCERQIANSANRSGLQIDVTGLALGYSQRKKRRQF